MQAAHVRLALAAALVLAGSAAADAKRRELSFPQGLYGNVQLGAESGDLGGFEVRFYTDPASGKPMAEFTLCEGWCNTVNIAEVTRTADGFTFSHVETFTDDNADGETHTSVYRLIRAGRGWRVALSYDGNDMTAGEPWRIKPLKQPFGLEVARSEGPPAEPAP